MKKLVSLLLATCMCLSFGVLLTACDKNHTHTYKTDWSKDALCHWHACEREDCTEVVDKANHAWDNGVVTTEATPDSSGIKTYTCTVCEQTKTETVEYDVVIPTISDWEQAFQNTLSANNLTYNKNQIVKVGNNSASDGVIKVYRDGNKIFMEGTCSADNEKDCYTLYEGDIIYHYTQDDDGAWSRTPVQGLMHIAPLADTLTPFAECYNSFTFDENTKTFSATFIEIFGINIDSAEIKIENGYITYFCLTMPSGNLDNVPTWHTLIIELSEYGKTSVTLPEITQ